MADPTRERGHRLRWLLRRWPTAVAMALTVPELFDGRGSDQDALMDTWGELFLLLPLLYLVLAKLRRRWITWPALVLGFVCVEVLRVLDLVAPSTFLLAVALAVLVWSGIDGQLRRDGEFRLQTLGMIGFGALALTGLAIDPDIGRYLVAAGWLLHGAWDFVHLWRDKVVARSFAEWCGVVDIFVGIQILFLL